MLLVLLRLQIKSNKIIQPCPYNNNNNRFIPLNHNQYMLILQHKVIQINNNNKINILQLHKFFNSLNNNNKNNIINNLQIIILYKI